MASSKKKVPSRATSAGGTAKTGATRSTQNAFANKKKTAPAARRAGAGADEARQATKPPAPRGQASSRGRVEAPKAKSPKPATANASAKPSGAKTSEKP